MRKAKVGVCVLTLLVLLAGGVNIGLAAVSVLQPTDDTWIDTRTPDNVFNYDPFDKVLHADYSYIGPHYCYSLLKFNLSSIPSDATITSASLHMYAVVTSDEHTFLYRMDHDAWDEDTTSWNSYEPYLPGGTQIGDADVFVPYDGDHWVDWSISLASWGSATDLADGLVTFVLKGDSSDLNYTVGANLCSKEYLSVGGDPYIPYLEITWVPEPATILGLLALGGIAASRRKTRPIAS